MIKITKHQEIVDDVAGETKYEITIEKNNIITIVLTLPEARELLKALKKKFE